MVYVNKTFNELMGLASTQEAKESFEEWKERGKSKITPYTVSLDGKQVKAFGDLDFVDGQKSFEYETTYGNVISLKGKRRPKTVTLNFIIEYDFINDNDAEMRQQVNDLETIKKNRSPVSFSIRELGVDFNVTLETLRVTYRGARDIYIAAELMEVYENDGNS